MDVFTELVCRPPRHTYDMASELGPSYFKLDDQPVHRRDLQVRNDRGLLLQCSHYVPLEMEEYPVVIYCHGNAGSRSDADDTVNLLLPHRISVFTFDFSGSGMSEGELCSLGFHERGDLQCIIKFLEDNPRVTTIGIWGRSMGAATALMVAGDGDSRVSALVLDSCFLSLETVASEIAYKYLRKVPFLESWLRVTRGGRDGEDTVMPFLEEGVQMLRAAVLARCAWDIKAVNPAASCARSRVPALFLHAEGDTLVLPRHSEELHGQYGHAEKALEIFAGDHNSVRPERVQGSVCAFLAKQLHGEGLRDGERQGRGAAEPAREAERKAEEEGGEELIPGLQIKVVDEGFLISKIIEAAEQPPVAGGVGAEEGGPALTPRARDEAAIVVGSEKGGLGEGEGRGPSGGGDGEREAEREGVKGGESTARGEEGEGDEWCLVGAEKGEEWKIGYPTRWWGCGLRIGAVAGVTAATLLPLHLSSAWRFR